MKRTAGPRPPSPWAGPAWRAASTWPYAEWTQDSIAPNWRQRIPEAVRTNNAKMQELLTSYELEIYEVVNDEKLQDRNIVV